MAAQRTTKRQERIQASLEELKGMVRAKYPDAQFEIFRGPEDPREIWLDVIVDIENAFEEVTQLLNDRQSELLIDERLPNWIDGDGRDLAEPDSLYGRRHLTALARLQIADLLLSYCPDQRDQALDHLNFAIREFRELNLRPELERALKRKKMLSTA